MNTDVLRAELYRLAEDAAEPAVDLADVVLDRRRAARRHRAAMAAAVLATLLVVGLVPVLLGGRGERTAGPGSDQWVGATRGSLADDAEFVEGLRRLPWDYQQWRSPDGLAMTTDPQPRPAPDWEPVVTDLAAEYPVDRREVVFAGDVPGARWALVVLTTTEVAYTAAWFAGPRGATPDQMRISGMPQSIRSDTPMAHVDVADPDRPLVVVASPGDEILLSERAVLEADGTLTRSYAALPDDDGDGVVVMSLSSSTRFGSGASVRVGRAGETVWHSAPSSAGVPAGIDLDNPRDWPIGMQSRGPGSWDPGYDFLNEALRTALSPIGLELDDLAAPELVALYQGWGLDSSAPAGSGPLVSMYSIRLPSGARVLVGGWTDAPGDTTTDGIRPPQGVTFVDSRPAGTDVATDLVAIDLQVEGGHALVVTGPEAAATAAIHGAGGAVLGTVPLVLGAGSVPFPAGAVEVQARAADGSLVGTAQITAGQIGGWGDDGDSVATPFSNPVLPPD
jgi:hypothetical protein